MSLGRSTSGMTISIKGNVRYELRKDALEQAMCDQSSKIWKDCQRRLYQMY
jgi:hypothetical protein